MPAVGSMHNIAFSRKVTGKQKMVRNEKGLWVKVEDDGEGGVVADPETVTKVREREREREREKERERET